MNTLAEYSVQSHVSELPQLHGRLVNALVESGLAGPQLHDVFANCVSAECVLCGMKITGEQFSLLASGDPAADADPKIKRLHQSYCARAGCDSYYYRVLFQPVAGLDWSQVCARLDGCERMAPVIEKPPMRLPLPKLDRKFMLRLSAGIVAASLFFLARHWTTGARIPLIQKAHHYETDLKTVER